MHLFDKLIDKVYINNKRKSFSNYLENYFISFIIYIVSVLILSIFLSNLNDILINYYSVNLLQIRKININKLDSSLNIIFVFCVVAPIFEEIMFRKWLTFKKQDILISFFLLVFFLSSKISNISVYSFYINIHFIINILISFFITSVLYFLIKNYDFDNIPPKKKLIFYSISSIAFGMIHIVNFIPFNTIIFWAYPFFILPQIISGFILGYLRIKDGIIWSVLLHISINSIAFLFSGF